MKILIQVGILFGLTWVSECIEEALPFVFPASVISLLLLLLLLLTRVIRVDHIREKSDFLLRDLGFCFVRAAGSIINYADVIFQHAGAFFTICVVSTVLTYGATAAAVQLTRKLLQRRKEAV